MTEEVITSIAELLEQLEECRDAANTLDLLSVAFYINDAINELEAS